MGSSPNPWQLWGGLGLSFLVSVGTGILALQFNPSRHDAYVTRLQELRLGEVNFQRGLLERRQGKEVGPEVAAQLGRQAELVPALADPPTLLSPDERHKLLKTLDDYEETLAAQRKYYSVFEQSLQKSKGAGTALWQTLEQALESPNLPSPQPSEEDRTLAPVVRQVLARHLLRTGGLPQVRELVASLQASLLAAESQQGRMTGLLTLLAKVGIEPDASTGTGAGPAVPDAETLISRLLHWLDTLTLAEQAHARLEASEALAQAIALNTFYTTSVEDAIQLNRVERLASFLGMLGTLLFALLILRQRKEVLDAAAARAALQVAHERGAATTTGSGRALSMNAGVTSTSPGLVSVVAGTGGSSSAGGAGVSTTGEHARLPAAVWEQQWEMLRRGLELSGEAALFVDEKGILKDMTDGAEKLLDCTRDQVLGQDAISLFLPEILVGQVKEQLADAASGQLDLKKGRWDELVVQRFSGDPRPVRLLTLHLESVGAAVFLLYLRDLGEKRRAQVLEDTLRSNTLQLERSSRELRLIKARELAIRDAAVDSIIGLDGSGAVVDFNPAAEQTFRVSAEEAHGQSLAAFLLLPGTTGRFRVQADGSVEGGEGLPLRQRLEVTALRHDGSSFPAEVLLVDVRLEGPALYYVFVRDITDRKRIEQLKNEFVSVVSHELRTPLTSIQGSLGLLEGGVMGELAPKVLELIVIARANAERLIRLVSDMLDLEKMEAGRMTLKLEALNAQDLLEQAVAGIEGTAAQAGVTVTLEVQGDFQLVGDRDKLIQVLVNLLSNAVKFSAQGQEIRLSVRALPEGVLRFEVQDQGPGIPPDRQERLFKKFQQVEASDGKVRRGTGLGLAISKAIVELHHGTIGVTSQVGKGSTFCIELPRELRQQPSKRRVGGEA